MAETQLPPLDVVGPDGRRVTISELSRTTTADALAAAFELEGVTIDGEVVPAGRCVVEVDALATGSRLGVPESDSSGRDPFASRPPGRGRAGEVGTAPPVEMSVVAGPDCAGRIPLSPGRHVLGRAPHADLTIDDPTLERHHAILHVEDGDVRFTQLAGGVPARSGGVPLEPGARLAMNRPVELGATVLLLQPGRGVRAGDEPATTTGHRATGDVGTDGVGVDREGVGGAIAPHLSDPWKRVVWRSPVVPERRPPETVVAPSDVADARTPPATGLVGAAVGALGAVVIAAVMDNAMFLLFAGLGAVTALVTWLVGVSAARRATRRDRLAYTREVERFARQVAALGDVHRVEHERRHTQLEAVLTCVDRLEPGIWARRVAASDDDAGAHSASREAMRATIGTATARWRPPVVAADGGEVTNHELTGLVARCARMDDVAAPVSLRDGEAIAFHGPFPLVTALARSIVVQLATHYGPADWRLVVVTAEPSAWAWADWLPHGAVRGRSVLDSGDPGRLADELAAIDTSRRLVVVTDDPTILTSRTGPLRRFLARSDASSIVVVDTDATVPAPCRRMLRVGMGGRGGWVGDQPESDEATDIVVAGVSSATADRAARRLARLVDPEDDTADGAGVPAAVRLSRLLPGRSLPTPDEIVERWSAGRADPAPRTPIGMSSDGPVDLDLVRDGPHGLIAGTTGSGKSELLRSLVLGLALEVPPTHLNVVLVDYKGGSTFDACEALPHTVGVVTDLDDGLAERALASLSAELHRREQLLRDVGAADLTEYRGRVGTEPIARLVVVIDEFAALATELPDFLTALVGIAQRGRSLGIHLLLATQRPAGVVNDDIRANTNLRIALRLHDRSDALDVVGDPLPAGFDRSVPGRAALRLGPDELVVLQSARCTGPVVTTRTGQISVTREVDGANRSTGDHGDTNAASELEALVEAVVDAARAAELPAARRPWLDPLPHPLTRESTIWTSVVGAPRDARVEQWATADEDSDGTDRGRDGTVGLVDDPGHQCRRPLRWSPEDGSLALIGSLGSGTTSTLIALGAATCRHRPPSELHLYVVDARGDDGLGALAALAHCGGVVRVTEHERLHRLFTRLVATIDERVAGSSTTGGPNGSPDHRIVLMVDGWSSLRACVETVERTDLHDLVRRVVSEGPAVGVVTVFADDGASPAIATVPVADRWVFGLDDPGVARSFGIDGAAVAPGRPGRLRVASTGLEAQVAVGAAGLAEIETRDVDDSGPETVGVLPALVTSCADTDPRWRSRLADRRRDLVVGIGADDLRPTGLSVPDGEPVLVVGSARSGVTSALDAVVTAWIEIAGPTARVERVGRNGHDHGRHGRQGLALDDLAALVDAISDDVLVVVDDAHRVDDVDGLLASIARGEHPHVTLVAGCRSDAIRSAYGHWTREVARARCGIVMSSRDDPAGDVFGVTIPRRPLVEARPGLGWLVDERPSRQAQLAAP